jgi:hypothetical protein
MEEAPRIQGAEVDSFHALLKGIAVGSMCKATLLVSVAPGLGIIRDAGLDHP